MSGVLNSSELLPALFRAFITLMVQYQVYIGVIKTKYGEFDFLSNTLIFMIIYIIVTLVLPRIRIISVVVLMVDSLLLILLVMISGRGASSFRMINSP